MDFLQGGKTSFKCFHFWYLTKISEEFRYGVFLITIEVDRAPKSREPQFNTCWGNCLFFFVKHSHGIIPFAKMMPDYESVLLIFRNRQVFQFIQGYLPEGEVGCHFDGHYQRFLQSFYRSQAVFTNIITIGTSRFLPGQTKRTCALWYVFDTKMRHARQFMKLWQKMWKLSLSKS